MTKQEPAMSTRPSFLIIALLIAAAPVVARAEGLSQEDEQKRQNFYTRGLSLQDEAIKFRAMNDQANALASSRSALASFRESLVLKGDLTVLRLAAQQVRDLGAWTDGYTIATDLEVRELRDTPPDDDGKKARIEILRACRTMQDEATAHIGFVVVRASDRPEGLRFKVAGKDQKVFGQRYPVFPSLVSVDATAPGFPPFHVEVQVGQGESPEVPIEFKRASPPVPPPVVVDPNAGSTLRTTGLIIGGAGVASVIAGAFFGVAANDAEASLKGQVKPGVVYDSYLQGIDSRGKSNQTKELIFLGAGGAALVGGAICYLVGLSMQGTEAPPSGHAAGSGGPRSLSMQPTISSRDVGAVVRVTF